MKILIITNIGMGLYKFRKELIQELVKENEVIVMFPRDEYIDMISTIGCEFIHLPLDRRGKNLNKDFLTLKTIYFKLREIKPDVVLTYTIKPNIYGGLICRYLKIPYISNITGLGTSLSTNKISSKILFEFYKIAISKAKTVFVQNTHNAELLKKKKIVSSNYKIIPGSGVNLNEYKFSEYPAENEINFLYLGRIMKDKGISELLDAFIECKTSNRNINLTIVGFCDDIKYENLLKKYDEKNIITYIEKQNDVRPFIKKSHVLILPSYHEGMSNVLLEAAAMGRPLIASNIPGCKEVIRENVNGLLVNPKDYLDLKDKMIKFLNLPYETRKKYGMNSRKIVEKFFDRKIIIDSYILELGRIKENEKL